MKITSDKNSGIMKFNFFTWDDGNHEIPAKKRSENDIRSDHFESGIRSNKACKVKKWLFQIQKTFVLYVMNYEYD